MQQDEFFSKGWCRFDHDPVLARWVEQVLPSARAAVAAPENASWLRCGGTWFAGVNVLPNDDSGAVVASAPMAGRAVDFIRESLGLAGFSWDRAQVSVVYPGYPQPMASESAAAFRYRRDRDAAHLDGLLREGPDNRRYLREHHAFVLGIPLVKCGPGASPAVVWEGSHEEIRRAFQSYLGEVPPELWSEMDITALYHRTRREIFATCQRLPIAAQPGESYLIHRLALHGIAPWGDTATAAAEGRMIAYFRPPIGDAQRWLLAP